MPFLRVQARSEAELRGLLVRVAAESARDVEKLARKDGIGAEVRAGQLRTVQASLRSTLAGFWMAVDDLIRARREEGIAAALRAGVNWDKMLLSRAGKSAAQRNMLAQGLNATADRNVRLMLQRFTHETIPLSQRVYHANVLSNGLVDRKVNSALGRGLSAREFAKEVRSLIRPDTPGGVSYAAMRLARTEINNAYHYASITDNAEKPFVENIGWRLSRSHPKKDKCDLLAAESPYPKDNVPAKPHPQCFCYVVPEVINEDDFVHQFQQGKYDSYLANKYSI